MKRFTVESLMGLFSLKRQPPLRADIVVEEPVEVRVGREYLEFINHGITPFFPSERLRQQLEDILHETQDPAVIGHHLIKACQEGDIIIRTNLPDGTPAFPLTYLSAKHYHFDPKKNTWVIIK